ncbi:MAG TPA: SDR family oxidoreductase [Thermomicrobiales bacterium]|nr:SDR family oxidoreductase [Thermomicrobiales bacterium]
MVTGAANGIGRAITDRLLRDGCAVVGVDIDEAQLAAMTADLPANRFASAVADISIRDQIAAAVHTALDRFGRLDILAANAAIADGAPFLEIEDRNWLRIIDVNVNGTFYCIQEVARVMARAGAGAIVVTSSTNGWFVESNLAHYNASKGAVIALVRSAAFELAPFGIRVNAVEPSMVKTRSGYITHDPAGAADYLKRVPMGRFAEPAEVAAAVAFLASDQASYITGQSLVLDGGLTLGIDMPIPQLDLPGLEGSGSDPSA